MISRKLLPVLFRAQTAAWLLFGVSCSPAVYKNIQTSLPPRPEGSPVTVYGLTDTVPAATVIGTVGIQDSGVSTNCGYWAVLELAKAETNKSGGDAFHLRWHKEPSIWGSSCHQIAGDMLLLGDSLAPTPTPAATESLAPNAAEQLPRSGVKKTNTRPEHLSSTLLLSAGYAFMTSEYYMPEGVTGNPKQGLSINAAYQWASRRGVGFGLRYSGYFSSYDAAGYKINLRLHYFGAEFALRQHVGRRWAFYESIGVGYARYCENLQSLSIAIGGIGTHLELGCEYKLARNVGLGVNLGFYGANFKKSAFPDIEYEQDQQAGISYFSLNGGLRFYF